LYAVDCWSKNNGDQIIFLLSAHQSIQFVIALDLGFIEYFPHHFVGANIEERELGDLEQLGKSY
jgi:hypothetical protein